ncbi:Kae1-associated kinase Bud32 [Candidatus Marsarchaeota G2 archaeon ECH_B_SAG-G16]|jgi:TP53 regulating kinase-like protein|uniref:non-specific serine/threonine protein kinase n=4 Tax=Candidatus Marsarchaeota TaxID=1978152 RepID=A0A2R6AK49_9ARCH|nr:MAG: Kae1-associated kinase Bud32 [Candidatus Marsarchaeota G1 archaeon BE_D]PSN89639.1 MAG: Kae1-associated kinase Bud32 [Candidatus Marsarchaeota G1 archaeon OSP_B]PSN89718.1 MAG: Kae1-associated kinase Bud32 [Candidatus Marsarchaeota G1 archaeon OSP_C]PSO03818.1 MAG: Kae1-associated kinase Bud32 [Candidatus Marsarchaeota G2 archaeon ECH_B_SAG-G16]
MENKLLGLTPLQVLSSGAEATLYIVDFFGEKCVMKIRKVKSYRNTELDNIIRKRRTILEAKLLVKACLFDVKVPAVYAVSKTHAAILMEYVKGLRLSDLPDSEFLKHAFQVGSSLGRLHTNGIIHGDPTPSNFIVKEDEVFIMDFGLGEFSYDLEAEAVDINLFLKVIESLRPSIHREVLNEFFRGYQEEMGHEYTKRVFERMRQLRLRGRYVEQRRSRSQ